MEGITYRTNNVSTLEEKNIRLFINYVENEFKIKDVFGKLKEGVFRKFIDFHIVIDGLSKISKQLETKLGVKGFEKTKRKTEANYEYDSDINNIYDDGERAVEEEEHYEKLYENAFGAVTETTSLDHAFEELIAINESFLIRCLKNIQENFINKDSTELLRKHFFPYFQIDKLIELHENLKQKFEIMKHSYITIGQIFENMREEFLVYCMVSSRMKTAIEFLADQMSGNPETQEKIKKLQREAKKTYKHQDDRTMFDLKDLLQMIPQHIMRYPMMLGEIQKHANTSKKRDIENEARNANDLMKNLVHHINQYATDHNYIETLKELKEEVKDVPVQNFHDFGVLSFEIANIDMKKVSGKSYGQYQLLLFENYLVALELTEEETFLNEVNWFTGTPLVTKMNVKRFYEHFKMKEFHEIRMPTHDKESSYIHLNHFNGPAKNANLSLVLRFPFGKMSDCEEVYNKLEVLRMNASTDIEKGSDHTDHDSVVFREEIEDNSETMRHSKCNDCAKFLNGKIQTGIKCNTCNALFHKECFAINKDEDEYKEEEEFDDPEDLNVIQTESIEDFYLGELDQTNAIKKLKPKRRGTFLLRSSQKQKGKYVITKKPHCNDSSTKEFEHVVVKTVTMDNVPWFYLEKGFAFKDLHDLIKQHRKSHKLYFPINSPESVLNERNAMSESIRTIGDKPAAVQKPPEIIVDQPFDEAFMHGEISKEEAEELLTNKTGGTFLVRYSNSSYKISLVLPSGNKVKHMMIHETEEMFSLTNQKKFGSLKDLVENYMNVATNHKFFLGQPLANPNAAKRDENRTDDDIRRDRDVSRRKEPYSLQFFHGSLLSRDASKMLYVEPIGTFLLRKNEEDEYRITYKKRQKVEHLKIRFRDSVYFLGEREDKPFSSLRRLVDHLKEEEQLFSIPLKSAIHEKRTSVAVFPQSSTDREEEQSGFEARISSSLRKICNSVGDTTQNVNESFPIAGPSGKNRCRDLRKASLQNTSLEEDKTEHEQEYENTEYDEELQYENLEYDEQPESESEDEDQQKYPCIGRMSNREAGAFIENRPIGSWILRENESGEKRITVKSPKKVLHIKLNEDKGLFSLSSGSLKTTLDELLQSLEEQGTLGVQIVDNL
eukprot:GFUD01028707.1.p1 GENE.GFUD01028707.1~~GFUD01028707.1.p1  ORF type:complete len:1203 (-),score=297.06 GFUD01028707.1:58-3408(-)